MATTVERKINFYRIDAGNSPSGRPIIFNPIPSLEHINNLDWISKKRYWKDRDKVYACWVDSNEMPCKIRLGNIRRSDFPQIEQLGEVSPLEIPETAGLVEQTHIVFLGDNIVGCDFNFYGPRISRLSYYLYEKAFTLVPPILSFNPLLRQDVYKQLQEFKYLKLFNLKIQSAFTETIKKIDLNLWRAFKGAQEAGEADIIELILQCSNRSTSKGWLAEKILEVTKDLFSQKEKQYDMKKFIVKGFNEKKQENVELDLLSDKLIIKKSILKLERRSRALNWNSAYSAIIASYSELKDEIASAASIEI